ncbi:MAG TPA: protein-glutamate O-methyltransferase CheR [Polyangiaceae bacterium]
MNLPAAAFDCIRAVVRERSAIVLEPGKEYLVEARLSPIARARGLANIEALARMLTPANPELIAEVVQAMTTNETSFFRDQHPFEALRHHVLPDVIRARRSSATIDVWCGACSTGQEPYSLAMLIRDHFPELAGWKLRIIATDLSTAVLDRAREAKYRQLEVNRGLSAAQLVKHFDREGLDWRLKSSIRNMVEFSQLNLLDVWLNLPRFDIVFMRNVLIYFDVEVKRAILKKVRQQLSPKGFLFLGGAETTLNLDEHFERAPYERAGCYRLTG